MMANLLIVHPLHVAEVFITVIITVIFEPKKLPLWVKCIIIAGVSFMVGLGGLDTYGMRKMELAITLTVYSMVCYIVALVIGVRYQRRRTDRMWILLSVVIGLAIFGLYARYSYRPVASVTDYYKEMNAKGHPAEHQQKMLEHGEGEEEDEYLRRIREEFLDVDKPERRKMDDGTSPPPPPEPTSKSHRRRSSQNRRPSTADEL